MKADTKGGDRYSDRIRDTATRAYIKEDVHLLVDFSKQNHLNAGAVIELLQRERTKISTLCTMDDR